MRESAFGKQAGVWMDGCVYGCVCVCWPKDIWLVGCLIGFKWVPQKLITFWVVVVVVALISGVGGGCLVKSCCCRAALIWGV